MKTFLFLDDERFPKDVTWIVIPEANWAIVRTEDEFKEYVTANGIPDHISFDNDLGFGCGEGIFCAQWMVDQVLDGNLEWNPHFQFTVHSMNNVAAVRITGLLNNFISFIGNETGG